MLNYEHNNHRITKETASALLGKKAYIVDIAEKTLASSKDSFEVSMWINDDNTKNIVISQCFNDEKNRIEKTIVISIQKFPRTKATSILYEYGTSKALHSTTYYADWTIPTAKKLQDIIEHVF